MGLHCVGFCLIEGKSVALGGLLDFFNSYSVCWSPTARIKFSIPSCTGLNRKGWETGRVKLHHLIRTDGFCIWLWIGFTQRWLKIRIYGSGEASTFGNLIPGLFGRQLQKRFLQRRHFQQQWQQLVWHCFFKLYLIVAIVEWNIALFFSS